jgi:seryl-tRNA synthetase
MHDARELLREESVARLARRGLELDTAALAGLVKRRADLIAERDTLRAELKRSGARAGAEAEGADREAGRRRKERRQQVEQECRVGEEQLRAMLLSVPNLPDDGAPDGGPADPMVEVRRGGERPEFGFTARDHLDLGVGLGILDPARAGKLSGARFMVTRGPGARLERALASFLLDLHTGEHGYVEHGVPHLVSPETMTGTGQLPKFAADLFSTGTGTAGRELLLTPTAEVPLVNLYRDEVLEESALPLALTACTPCYRGEAGSYGRDTRGLIRLHQFEKVELVRIVAPERAAAELDLIVAHAEEALRRLGLHYRVVELRAGDLGFAARRTFDLEVWLPGQEGYREISSCSDCGSFQARRAGIRLRGRAGRTLPVTLNGSALPIGRTLAAILEQNQQPDGSVVVPPVLVPYTGFEVIGPPGRLPTS